MLRGALTYFNVERPLCERRRSSAPGQTERRRSRSDWPSLTARAGKQAILVDADLRRPQVSARLGIPAGRRPRCRPGAERHACRAAGRVSARRARRRRLLVLPAGPPPANPVSADQLAGNDGAATRARRPGRSGDHRHGGRARGQRLAAADQDASGVLMIVRMNRSSRAAVDACKRSSSPRTAPSSESVATGSGAATYGYGRMGYYTSGTKGPG